MKSFLIQSHKKLINEIVTKQIEKKIYINSYSWKEEKKIFLYYKTQQ